MLPTRSLSTAGLLLTLGGAPTVPPGLVNAQLESVQAKPMEVTSDTPEYCLHLVDRVSALVRLATAPVPHEVTDLSTEGQQMCAHGQTRGGIMRLRNALLLMQKRNGAASR
jgi:hypothetical protein